MTSRITGHILSAESTLVPTEHRVLRSRDQEFMRLALTLARRGLGATSPNPAVGAVVVRRGEIVGRGWHKRAGGPHAEVIALAGAGARARGAELFVTLEPCSHHGRTPPCAEAIIAAGVRRVVAATVDPNPLVRGSGLRALRRTGVRVDLGCLATEARELNAGFFMRMTASRPLVTLKAALSLDGRIATHLGESQWITGEGARRAGHDLRGEADAVAIGVDTLLHDDPRLTVRSGVRRAPRRVLFDSDLRTPARARVLHSRGGDVLILAAHDASARRAARLSAAGARVLSVPRTRQGVSIRAALHALAAEGINHLLVEGGGRLATSFLAARLVDRIAFFYAPIFLGGARLLVGDIGVRRLSAAPRLERHEWSAAGTDLCVRGVLASRGA